MIVAKELMTEGGGAPDDPSVSFSVAPEIVVLSQPNGLRAEAVRTLRTHIMAQHVEDGRRGLAICAPEANVGTTFVAVNLAVALAQIGNKVLLIDADMRQPQVDSLLTPSRAVPGLAQCLASIESDISPYIQSEVLDNLSVMYSGGVALDAQELLGGDRFASLMARCMRDFDMTIVDTPPANSCADARRVSTVIGYSVIVARRHQTYVGDVKALAAQLKDDRAVVVGSVMNEA